MSEQALYRKYRSATFGDVIGQQHVVTTLSNAIATDKLSHAYLFTGPRGVGKTSVARLLARAANCTDKDPAKRPCGVCENCKTAIGGHLDLIEIDAASNRGIDDARALREKITSAPSLGRYKVYIIDEVHMLTTEAFNALLKTLEEPPAHALFILATTEAHKLPDTIISRTQRFSFKPIDTKSIVDHLGVIAKKEKITIDKEALELIAEASQGGFRDAISLLDQVGSSGVTPLTATTVREMLGQSDPAMLQRIADAVAARDAKAALAGVDEALVTGVQASQLANQLLGYWRKLIKTTAAAKEVDPGALQQAVEAVERLLPVTKSPWPELALEAALVGLCVGRPRSSAQARVTQQAVARATAAPKVAEPEGAPTATPKGSDEELWLKSLTQIKQRNNSLYALLRSSVNVQFDGDELILGCRFGFHRDRLKEAKNQEVISQVINRVYGRKFRITPTLEAKTPVAQVAATQNSELVSSALEILGGEVVHD